MVESRRWRALALLCTANFMVILDSQIVVLALPSIERELGFAPGAAQWVLTAYLVSFGGLLLLGGRAGDLLGRRAMFMAGTGLFLVSSLLCGLAWTGEVLIAARIVQGISAAAMAPSALSLVMTTFTDGAERNKALAVWAGTGGFGATAALLIGGGLTGALGWEWIFFLNVPVAVVMLTLSPVLLHESRDRKRARAYDPAGAVTVTAALAVGIYAVAEAPVRGWLSGQTLGLLAASAALFAVFAKIENRSAAPLVPLRVFRSRTLTGGNLVMVTCAMCAFGMSFVVAQYAQLVLGYSPLVFGLSTAVMPLMAVVGAGIGQGVLTKIGSRPVATTGMALIVLGLLLLTRVSPGGAYLTDLFPGLLVFGLGLGAASVGAAVPALSGVAESESGLASGINSAAFQIGGATGVAVVSTVLTGTSVGGFQTGFGVAIGFGALGLLAGVALLRRDKKTVVTDQGDENAVPVADLR